MSVSMANVNFGAIGSGLGTTGIGSGTVSARKQ